ncbi:hypothetical protein [Mangrovibacterium diazotrophicum]|uniref:Fibronectin type-III domain-containing protein n=1 Tax=Mangrovibacterium diazotrophicum TaxID=1261403 RepID=A0A419W8Q7_9BACT|nr:hypothetical protein [Mangrovibacterium diazotrophicum]RKD91853.1 hypothetical protein BC643_2221 [Mangrovibacterium diazotrophicum]
MKKLLLSLCMLAFVAITSNVFGQSTDSGITPFVGSTHTYSVTANASATFAWTITTDVAGSSAVASTIAEVTAGAGTEEVSITWHNPAAGTTYYVHVTETLSGCSNHKAIAVSPVNGFELEIVNVDSSNGDLAQDAAQCAPAVVVDSYAGSGDGTLTDAQNFVYDYGTVDLYYKITASGINTTNTGWSPQFTIATTNTTGATVTATWGTTSAGTGGSGALTTDGVANDIDVASGNASIWVKVTIDNGTAMEGLTAQDITVTLLDAANTSEDENGNDVTDVNNGNRKQVVSARPNSGVIVTTEP